MFFKAIITKVKKNNKFEIRIPILETPGSREYIVDDVCLCYQPGNLSNYAENDVVFINFEYNNDTSKPVIIGKLYKGIGEEDNNASRPSRGYVYTNTLNVTNKAILPTDTKIGNIDFNSISSKFFDDLNVNYSANTVIAVKDAVTNFYNYKKDGYSAELSADETYYTIKFNNSDTLTDSQIADYYLYMTGSKNAVNITNHEEFKIAFLFESGKSVYPHITDDKKFRLIIVGQDKGGSTATNLINGEGPLSVKTKGIEYEKLVQELMDATGYTRAVIVAYLTAIGITGDISNINSGLAATVLGIGNNNFAAGAFINGVYNTIGTSGDNSKGVASAVFGVSNNIQTENSITVGDSNIITRANGSGAFGNANKIDSRSDSVTLTNSFAFGNHLENNYSYCTSVGRYNLKYQDGVAQKLFQVGNGTADNARSNAFEVYQDGSAKLGAMGTDNLSVATKGYVDLHGGAANLIDGTGTGSLQQNDGTQSYSNTYTSIWDDVYNNVPTIANILTKDPINKKVNVLTTGALGANSFQQNGKSLANGKRSLTHGSSTIALGEGSHAEGNASISIGSYSHAEGNQCLAISSRSHAEGSACVAAGANSHAEGNTTKTTSDSAHAEGAQTLASGGASHAEGQSTTASANSAHAEGNNTHATGSNSHAEGLGTTASGHNSHAEGQNTDTNGMYNAHCEGNCTKAGAANQTVVGSYNDYTHDTTALFVVGNGAVEGSTTIRQDAFRVLYDGTIVLPNYTDSTLETRNGYRKIACINGVLTVIDE